MLVDVNDDLWALPCQAVEWVDRDDCPPVIKARLLDADGRAWYLVTSCPSSSRTWRSRRHCPRLWRWRAGSWVAVRRSSRSRSIGVAPRPRMAPPDSASGSINSSDSSDPPLRDLAVTRPHVRLCPLGTRLRRS